MSQCVRTWITFTPEYSFKFQDSILPDKIKIGCMNFPVRLFVPPLLWCFKCQRYGHIAVACKRKQMCAKCGGNHRFTDCGDNVQACNCGGQHTVTYGDMKSGKEQ